MLASLCLLLVLATSLASGGTLPRRATAISATPFAGYQSSVGVLGCKINANRVAHFPLPFDCNSICLSVTSSSRTILLLRIDQSSGAFDISYDAWNILAFGVSAADEPHLGGPIDAEYEAVDNALCADLLDSNGKLPFVFSSGLGGCLADQGSWVAQNGEVFNIQDALLSSNTTSSDTSDTSQITSLLTSYSTALSTRDTSLAVSLYTSDGVIMPPHFSPSVGTAALTESYARIFSSVHLSISFAVDEVVVTSPGWGFARTTARGTKKMLATGEEEEHANQELFIVKNEDGQWKIARYAFSSMKPLVQNGVRRS